MRVYIPQKLSGKYKFIKNYDFPTYRQDIAFVNFKTNDVVSLEYFPEKSTYSSLAGNYIEKEHFLYKSDLNNLNIKIPLDYVVKVDDNSTLSKISNSNLQELQANTQQAVANAQQPFLEKHKNHLLLLLAVVAGYFAYKKFKK
jgi:hypothetical protein